MDKPEALRLADWLDGQYDKSGNCEAAADELRRLHAENEVLRQQHLDAHRNSGTLMAALTEISMLTHLGGEVAEYEDVVDAVRQMRDHLISEGWRQCAKGQKTTQWCAQAADRLARHGIQEPDDGNPSF